MPIAIANWKPAVYNSMCEDEGAGKEMPVPGIGAKVRDIKKSTILFQRLMLGRLTM